MLLMCISFSSRPLKTSGPSITETHGSPPPAAMQAIEELLKAVQGRAATPAEPSSSALSLSCSLGPVSAEAWRLTSQPSTEAGREAQTWTAVGTEGDVDSERPVQRGRALLPQACAQFLGFYEKNCFFSCEKSFKKQFLIIRNTVG